MMRWLIRLILLALAAFGAKTLYDRWYGATAIPATRTTAEPEHHLLEPYEEEVRVQLEEVVAAPYDPEIGIPVET